MLLAQGRNQGLDTDQDDNDTVHKMTEQFSIQDFFMINGFSCNEFLRQCMFQGVEDTECCSNDQMLSEVGRLACFSASTQHDKRRQVLRSQRRDRYTATINSRTQWRYEAVSTECVCAYSVPFEKAYYWPYKESHTQACTSIHMLSCTQTHWQTLIRMSVCKYTLCTSRHVATSTEGTSERFYLGV